MADAFYDLQSAARPLLQDFYIADLDETWESIARARYDVHIAGNVDEERVAVVVSWLKAANPGAIEGVSAGHAVHIPVVPGISPLFLKITPPQLPDPKEKPPDPSPLEDPPLNDYDLPLGPAQGFYDTVHRGCTYTHQFMIRGGPVQAKEIPMGWTRYVRFVGRTSVGIGPASVTWFAQFCIVEAKRVLVKRWQWQEVWDKWVRICPQGVAPGNSAGYVRVAGTGKWVHLGGDVEDRDPVDKECEWTSDGPGPFIERVDKYIEQLKAKGDNTTIHGNDVLLPG
jgi:hypothetical protein